MKLVGAVSQPSGKINEDGMGWIGPADDISAAWVFDGVTGINPREYLGAGSDAQWFVARAQAHLEELAGRELDLPEILTGLIDALIADWQKATASLALPADHDPPATCLVLAKRFAGGWQAVRLGDSCLFSRGSKNLGFPASPVSAFEAKIVREATHKRGAGAGETPQLLAEFRPRLLANRQRRNQPGGYGILEASRAALDHAEYLDLGKPRDILICTDGFYRAVDIYSLYRHDELLERCASRGGVETVLAQLRAAERSDPLCRKYPRFKPADDATALALVG